MGWTRKLTVEVLAIELLNELQHHSVYGALPQCISCRETLKPCRLSVLVLSSDTEH